MEQQPAENKIELRGTVDAVMFTNPENGYTVLALELDDGEQHTVTGCLPFASPGERITAVGSWTRHPTYGRQFKADYAVRTVPEGAEAIYEYLASHVVRGVGPATAAMIVERFGDAALDVIENHPEQLSQLRGISRAKAADISASYKRQMGIRRLMEFLARYGIKPVHAMHLYRLYGDEAQEKVQENPYLLASDQVGASFEEADELAIRIGVEADAPERVAAAIQFELLHNLSNGHSFIPREKLVAATAQLIAVEQETVAECLELLAESGEVVVETVAGREACYLFRIWEMEQYTALRLRAMAASREGDPAEAAATARKIAEHTGIAYAPLQEKALQMAALRQLLVLTGGPGTGKTTTLRGILQVFDRMGLKTLLCAPTGRAAKRMTELTGREASTVHRLLESSVQEENGGVRFGKDEEDPLTCDAVILDECSMVDIVLISALLRALPSSAKLVLVGDADQLPSVGPGSFLREVIRSGVAETICLTEVFRQSANSRIITCAHQINRGEHPNLRENKGDLFLLRRKPQDISETVVELCRDRLPGKMGIPPEDIQVLSPTRLYEAGTTRLNATLQAALNPPAEGKREKAYGDKIFREGDRVMQIKNNYDILWKAPLSPEIRNPEEKQLLVRGAGIFNGDVGVIKQIDPKTELVTIDFDGRYARYSAEMLHELDHAFAMTVHKAQGSEYRAVILALGKLPQSLINRSLLYTAATRAKSLLILVGSEMTALQMIDSHKVAGRYSGLRWRLAEGG